MSKIVEINGRRFAVELHWTALLTRGTASERVAAEARKIGAPLYVKHTPPRTQGRLVVDEEVFGFYTGAASKVGISLRKKAAPDLLALASVFSSAAEQQSLWILGLGEGHYLVLGCKNSQPVVDELHTLEGAVSAALKFKQLEAVDGAQLYLSGDVDPTLSDALESAYPASSAAPATFTEPNAAASTAAKLQKSPRKTSIVPLVIIACVSICAFFAWDVYQEKQAEKERARKRLAPDQIYRSSRDEALRGMALVPFKSWLKAMRSHAAWTDSAGVPGWTLASLSCEAVPGTPEVHCVRAWERNGGTFEDLSSALKRQVAATGLELASDDFVVTGETVPPEGIGASIVLESDWETRLSWGSWLQRLKDISAGHTESKSGARSPLEAAPIAVDLGVPALVGIWPQPQMPVGVQGAVKAGDWKVTGGLGWLEDLEGLPPHFMVDKFEVVLGSTGGFSAIGRYLVKP